MKMIKCESAATVRRTLDGVKRQRKHSFDPRL